MMTASRNQAALLYSRLPVFARKVQRARSVVERALEEMEHPYIALSGGKDSTAVRGLVCEFIPDIPAIWSDDEWWLPETGEYIDRLRGTGADVRQIRTNAWHADWFQIAGDWDGIPDYARQHGFDGVFLGLRQDESRERRIHLRTLGALFRAQSDGFWHCNPIHDWEWQDVWAYILTRNLDYNRAYDKLEHMGVPPDKQRIGPLAVDKVLGYGQLATLKSGWPDLFNRFAEAHPEARLYV